MRWLELAEKLRQIKPLQTREQRLKQLEERSKARQKYARRQWNGKTQTWEKVWKPYPPTDPFRAWE